MTLSDDYLNIDTPENVAFGYEVAGIGSRFLAALVDTLLILVLQLVVNLTLLFLASVLFGSLFEQEDTLLFWFLALFGLIAFALLWGYYIFFELSWNGQSPGKRWIGLRVIRTDGTPITLTESIIRNLVRLIDFLPAYYGVGVVVMFINDQARRLGDLAAGTLVVRERANVTLESLAAKPPPFHSNLPASTPLLDLPIDRLTPRDIQMAEAFLQRRYEFTNRLALARRLAQTLNERMELPPRPLSNLLDAENFIMAVVQANQSRGVNASSPPDPLLSTPMDGL